MSLTGEFGLRQYSKWTEAKWLTPDPEKSLAIAALGLVGEAGEVTEQIKKHLRDGRRMDREHMVEELGDMIFYWAFLCNRMGIDPWEVLEYNVQKLEKRYPEVPADVAGTGRHRP